ncbi:AraC family transcriptional regulator [Bosea caraganae]|uniref:AraC family transcriptional regulator n=1 Tax=Bosea caraganae TaxID=2763117 RepID=A0A370LBH1_9HYPH|nr:AraC family transcriptional regulator [Bosea caraganae]RDJ27306.1 AraC family transcriptional regulator [Bosea caraganae]RDJ29322.1 AraC family transcriptional regulator [Bosea caraganae]
MSSNLKDAILRYIDTHDGDGEDGIYRTVIDGLFLMRTSHQDMPKPMVYRPALCLVVQGAKQVMFGDELFAFGEMQALVVSLALPAFGKVVGASTETPFLALALEFDIGVMRQVMEELDDPPRPAADAGPAVFVDALDGQLADCFLRLLRLLDTPKAVPVLSPAIMREICFWLLTGPNRDKICKLALPDSHTQRIARALHVLRDHFAEPIRIERLAETARMSPSSFHQHFKTLTAMTPLQYQKHLRLLEARRLMVADGSNVAEAAYEVGYESASQFSREYARMFGAPPKRSLAELKALPA